ncbi:DUF2182 domain-containing protein [Paraherbaspirillum soli]|uniref:DUF2182 domain-containing protein n=1 Tax=Paraherbaspirillum soli TaxID=631222 RepID=A0ABW0M5T8_9BURK
MKVFSPERDGAAASAPHALQTASRRVSQFADRHPEWWLPALSLGAWSALFWQHAQQAATGTHPAHHMHHAAGTAAGWGSDLVGWVLMVAAMMLPLVIDPAHTAALRSLWRRRHRAIAGYLSGYLAVWMIAGLVSLTLLAAIKVSFAEQSRALAFGFAIAAAWQLTPYKRLALSACHRTMPLAPRGWRADYDCIRYGLQSGRSCVLSCWALMLLPMLASHNLWLMLVASAVCAVERYRPRPEVEIIGAGLIVIAAGLLVY